MKRPIMIYFSKYKQLDGFAELAHKIDFYFNNVNIHDKNVILRELLRCSIDARGVISGVTFEYVPLQDFTSQSDIDWSKSIADIDKQLYAKYNLTQEEIDYIEATITPM